MKNKLTKEWVRKIRDKLKKNYEIKDKTFYVHFRWHGKVLNENETDSDCAST